MKSCILKTFGWDSVTERLALVYLGVCSYWIKALFPGNQAWRSRNEALKNFEFWKMVVLLNYFIKTHNQIKASRSEEELSNSIRNIDKEIKSIEKQLALISGSYSSFKNIKEEYGSFLSQLFDIKRDYQYYATEIQKFRKISAAMEQSSTSRSKNKDTNYSEYFISQLEGMFILINNKLIYCVEVINTGLSNLTRITSQSGKFNFD